MAPPPNHSHLTPSPLPFHHRLLRRCSKAQMSFFNILHIISFLPSADFADYQICDNRELVADVNVRLRPPSPATVVNDNCVFEKNDRCESESVVADESELTVEDSKISHVGDKSSGVDNNRVSELVDVNVHLRPQATVVNENYVFEKNDGCEIESFVANESELAVEESEISHVGDQSSSVDNNNRVKPRDEGYLGLLIEAAELILVEDSISDHDLKLKPSRRSKSKYVDATARGGAKRKTQCWTAAAEAEWYAEFEEASPVVKSKRGRNQVLPYKYRDSVVERWSSATSNDVVPSRRRS